MCGPSENLRGSRSHLAEESWAVALLRGLLGRRRRVSSSAGRTVLLRGDCGRPLGKYGRASRGCSGASSGASASSSA